MREGDHWKQLNANLLQIENEFYAGIRPKISGPSDPARDFEIQGPAQHGVAGLVNLFGIESPGLTSSLALGDHVAQLLAA